MSAGSAPVARSAIRLAATGAPTLALQLQRADVNANDNAAFADVIYVHGSTFGADLSVFFPFDGLSWADALNAAGMNVWGFDFAGYGGSDRYPQDDGGAVGGLAQVLPQLQQVIEAVRERNGGRPVHLLAHSWGATVAAAYVASLPAAREQIDSLILFAPVVARAVPTGMPMPGSYVAAPAGVASHYPLTLWAQYRRFIEDVPRGLPQPLAEAHFHAWGERFLATDAASGQRLPPAVMTPTGPQSDVRALWSGSTLYDASAIQLPVLLLRGEWDSVCNQDDASSLLAALGGTHNESVTIPGATHLMHLESQRGLLYNAVNLFLSRSVK